MTNISHDRLLIIDFGSQVTQLLPDACVVCLLQDPPYQRVTMDLVRTLAPKAVIFPAGQTR